MLLGFDGARLARICPKAMRDIGKILSGGPSTRFARSGHSTRVHLAEGHEGACREAGESNGWGRRIRTPANGFRARRPTTRRSPSRTVFNYK